MSSISKTTTLSLGDAGAGADGASSHRSYDTRDRIMLGAVVILFSIILLILALHFFVRWLVVRLAARRLRRQRLVILSRRCGLDPATLKSLPVLLFSASEDGQKAGECAVCLDRFEDGQRVRSLPRCGHCFHADCVDVWFLSHSNCPLCRAPAEPALSASESASAAEVCSSSLPAPGDAESVIEASAGESNGSGEHIQLTGLPLALKRHIAKEFLTRVFGLNRVGTLRTEPDLETGDLQS